MNRDDDVLTPDEVARKLRCSRETVYRMIRRGDLRSLHVGRHHRVKNSAIDALSGNYGQPDTTQGDIP